ncbi:haloacid dehalogenase type II [Cognatishimia sp. WU-CL00825]|uniref:haloacid dehalogenase type II n=1 Tax=Cognatishimia sp. WU-CL00825 TaxID=3127658 RepID=UPI003109E314
MSITTCIFDAYGTLFDVSAAARQAAAEPEHAAFATHWDKVSADWRNKQLQYTWLRAITHNHTDFWQVTQEALDWSLQASGLENDTDLRRRLLQLYWELSAYPEVPEMLKTLKSQGLNTGILSNGSPDMLDGAVKSAGLSTWLDDVLSVESVGVFKPDSRVYDLVLKRFNCTADEVLFVSSNGWDVAGASGFGFQTVWVNRAAEPVDCLPHGPDHQLKNLTEITKIAGI